MGGRPIAGQEIVASMKQHDPSTNEVGAHGSRQGQSRIKSGRGESQIFRVVAVI
jgi:hypothetical protein